MIGYSPSYHLTHDAQLRRDRFLAESREEQRRVDIKIVRDYLAYCDPDGEIVGAFERLHPEVKL